MVRNSAIKSIAVVEPGRFGGT